MAPSHQALSGNVQHPAQSVAANDVAKNVHAVRAGRTGWIALQSAWQWTNPRMWSVAMGMDVALLAVSLVVILVSSTIFTNAIEHLGDHLKMHQGAVGSILAAVGTALPETVIPIIAIVIFRDEHAQKVAIGAIAGAPFMLATLAFFVTGVAVVVYSLIKRRPFQMKTDVPVLTRDLTFFVTLYGLAIAVSFVHEIFFLKVAVAIILLAGYGFYIHRTITGAGSELEEFEPLYLSRIFKVQPRVLPVLVQLALSLVLMIYGAHMFVAYVEDISISMGISALVLSIIITPIATELPEKFNSVIWVGKNKDVLALGNITGAMVFQSCFPVAFGIVFTHWDLTLDCGITMASAVLAFASAFLLLAWVRLRRSVNPIILLVGGLLYAAFIVYMLTCGIQLSSCS